MKKHEAIKYFGGVVQLATAIGITPQSVSQWGTYVPQGRAYQIEVLTGGQLKASSPKRQTKQVGSFRESECVKRAIDAASVQSAQE
ncbi:Cro/CI family transcriptional regulator [Aeromonas caviae]